MTDKIVRFANIYHPAYLGGEAYCITQQSLYITSEKAIRTAVGALKNGAGELLHDCVQVEWTPESDEHDYVVPEGCIVRFMNIQRPASVTPENYAAGQIALYPTAKAAKARADHIRKGYWMIDTYTAVAVPVVFKGLPMADGWVKNDQVNYEAVHREELQVVDMTPTDYPQEIKEKYNV